MEEKEKLDMSKKAKSELDKINEYSSKGYTTTFKMRDGALTDVSSDKGYGVDDVKIIHQHRYEGMSNPGDLSILFVIETKDGNKGLLLRPYGPKAVEEIDIFLTEVARNEESIT